MLSRQRLVPKPDDEPKRRAVPNFHPTCTKKRKAAPGKTLGTTLSIGWGYNLTSFRTAGTRLSAKFEGDKKTPGRSSDDKMLVVIPGGWFRGNRMFLKIQSRRTSLSDKLL